MGPFEAKYQGFLLVKWLGEGIQVVTLGLRSTACIGGARYSPALAGYRRQREQQSCFWQRREPDYTLTSPCRLLGFPQGSSSRLPVFV